MDEPFFSRARRLGFRRRSMATLLCLYLATTAFEGIGIGMALPIFQFIQAGEDLNALTADSRLWQMLVEAFGFVGVPVSLASLLIAAFLSIVCRQVFIYLRMTYTARVRSNLIADLQKRMFQGYLGASIDYHEREASGKSVDDFVRQSERAINHIIHQLDFLGFSILAAMYAVVLVVLSPTMAALGAVVLGGVAFALRGLLHRTRQVGYGFTEAMQRLSGYLAERLTQIRLIRLSGTEANEARHFRQLADVQRDRATATLYLAAQQATLMEPMVAGAALVLVYVGVRLAGLGIDTLGLFILVLVRMLPIFRQVLTTRQVVLTTEGSAAAVLERLDAVAAAAEGTAAGKGFTELDREIRFEAVSFTYPDAPQRALEGVNLVIPARRLTALVGPSGGGKSTLVDLLPRMREPTSGRILFDDIALTDIDRNQLRASIGFVPQTPLILSGTPADHIRYGCDGAGVDEIREAARRAGAHDFIMALTKGYDTQLPAGGIGLSGGQRQRLDLARALLRRATILVLDEPTSHLDADSEGLFRQTLQELRSSRDMTIIVIGHHLVTVAAADQIVVMAGGRIDAVGHHDALLAEDGWYARAFRKQATA